MLKSAFVNLCALFRKIFNFGIMYHFITIYLVQWLKRLANLVPYVFGAFIVTCLIQVSMFKSAFQNVYMGQEDTPELPVCVPVNTTDLPLWEQPTLLNLTNFRWIMTNASTCTLDTQNNDTRVVLVLVHTARPNFRERMSIRKSYGSIPMYKNWTLRFAFLLGEPNPTRNSTEDLKLLAKERKQLLKEQETYGDVVIGSFVDSYHNLTYKHMMGYKWALTFCPNAEFVLKVDDDMFIDIMRWLDWRTRDMKLEKAPELYGFNYGGGEPIRDNGSKWYAPEEEFPDKHYPDYCSGWGYGISIGFMKRLFLATQKVNFFWIDDVYATGVLLKEVRKEDPKPVVKYLGDKISGQVLHYRPMCRDHAFHKKRKFKSVTYVERTENMENEMMCMWNKTLHDSTYKF